LSDIFAEQWKNLCRCPFAHREIGDLAEQVFIYGGSSGPPLADTRIATKLSKHLVAPSGDVLAQNRTMEIPPQDTWHLACGC
jgi:hypothetical protein